MTVLRSRAALVALALTVPLALSGCSGGDDDQPASTPNPNPSPQQVGEQIGYCQATVAVTGDVKAEWSGRATVNLRGEKDTGSGPAARYVTTKGKNQLSVFSTGPDFAGTTTLVAGQDAYTSTPDSIDNFKAAEDGTSAIARGVRLTGLGSNEATLYAKFACGPKYAPKTKAPRPPNQTEKAGGKKGAGQKGSGKQKQRGNAG